MKIAMAKYLSETKMLDYSADSIRELVQKRRWREKDEYLRIKEIYDFVRNEILFGYNVADDIPASRVLSDGYGQCNTKGTLFMALLRASGVLCRFHGFTIGKQLQKGAMTGIVYKRAPDHILHSWVEVFYKDKWYNLEGYILDEKYLKKLQAANRCEGAFCGYGVAVKNFENPVIEWNGNDTYIQSEGITYDFGVFDSPDAFFERYTQDLSRLKAFLYRCYGRRAMNRNVKKIRKYGKKN